MNSIQTAIQTALQAVIRAIIYARYSTDHQREASIEDQVRVCEQLAKQMGFEVVRVFSDAAISGGTHQRPGYQAMLTSARAGEFDVILCEDISRLWRNRAEFGPRSAELEDLGIHMVTCVGDDTRRDGWGLTIQIKLAMAEHQRREASYRTFRGLEGKAKKGTHTGGRAYGYDTPRDNGTDRMTVNQAEAEVVRRIYTMYADGMSPRSIAKQLNDEGVPSPGTRWKRKERRSHGWLASAINGDTKRGVGILNNARYVGIVIWGRAKWARSARDSDDRRCIPNAQPTHEYVDESLRIVPQELWERVRARHAQRQATVGAAVAAGKRKRGPGAGRPPRYPLSGVLRCSECGAAFTLFDRARYGCASHINGNACTNDIRVRRDLAHRLILEGVQRDLLDPAVVAEVERRVAEAMKQAKPRENHKAKLGALEREVRNLSDALALHGVTSRTLLDRLQAAEQELERLRVQAATPMVVMPAAFGVRAKFAQLVADIAISTNDPERARAALQDAIGPRVVLRPDTSRTFLWAEYGRQEAMTQTPLAATGTGGAPEFMVAGAGFEPATFGL